MILWMQLEIIESQPQRENWEFPNKVIIEV